MAYKFGSSSGSGTAITFYVATDTGNPADSSTYTMATGNVLTLTVDSDASRFYIPQNGTINKVYINFNQVAGSAENATLNILVNGTSTTTVSNTLKFNTNSTVFSTTSLGLSLSAGDYFQFKFVTPAWATNPTTCYFTGTAVLE